MIRPPMPLLERLPYESRKPHNLPEPAKGMTIALGMICTDGVLLCADSQMSVTAYLKYSENKIVVMAAMKCRPFFAYAGNVAFSKECILRLGTCLQNATDTEVDLDDALRAECRQIHLDVRQLYPEPSERPILDMLIAWRREGRILLYHALGPHTYPVQNYMCIGAGTAIATATIGALSKVALSLRDASFVAAYALYQAKQNVDGCGEKSLIVLIPNRGRFDCVTDLETLELENSYQEVQQALAPILISRGSQAADRLRLGGQIRQLVKALRKAQSKRGQPMLLFEGREVERQQNAAIDRAVAEAEAEAENPDEPPTSS